MNECRPSCGTHSICRDALPPPPLGTILARPLPKVRNFVATLLMQRTGLLLLPCAPCGPLILMRADGKREHDIFSSPVQHGGRYATFVSQCLCGKDGFGVFPATPGKRHEFPSCGPLRRARRETRNNMGGGGARGAPSRTRRSATAAAARDRRPAVGGPALEMRGCGPTAGVKGRSATKAAEDGLMGCRRSRPPRRTCARAIGNPRVRTEAAGPCAFSRCPTVCAPS